MPASAMNMPKIPGVVFDCFQAVNNPFLSYASDGPLEPGDTHDADMGGAHPAEYQTWSGPCMAAAPASMVKSAKIAIEAEGEPVGSPKRVLGAQRALKVNEHCTEAFYLLGYEAKTREEALRWFEKGIAAGPLFVGTEEYEESRRDGNTWYRVYMRGFYRCLFGAANILRRMGRYEEAYAKYKQLLEFDTRIHTYVTASFATAVNPLPSFIECLLGLGKWGEAAAHLFSREASMAALALKPDAYITWTYTRVLVAMKLGKAPELPGQDILQLMLTTFWEGACGECAAACKRLRRVGAGEAARGHSCRLDRVLAMLAGEALPDRREPSELAGAASTAACRSYARHFGKHWRAQPEILSQVLEWDRIVRDRCAGPGRRECPLKVIGEFAIGRPASASPRPAPQAAAPLSSAAERSSSSENVPPANGAVCSACGRTGTDMRRCGSCRRAQYCDEKCQRAHWPSHKAACREAAQKVPAAAAPRSAPSAPAVTTRT
eukprot:tig00000691_g3164.t1